MKRILLAGCIGLALISTPVFAYDYSYTETAETRSGFEGIYAGAGVGVVRGDGGKICDELNASCMSWKAYAGYRSSEHLAFEGGYHNLIKASSSMTEQRVDVTALSMSVLGITTIKDLDFMPAHKDIEVFGKVGMAAWDRKLNDTSVLDGTDFLLGGGAQMKFSDNLGLRGEVEYIGGDVDSTNYSAGMTYSTF